MGVDFLSIDGFECAGHVGETDIPNMVLLSRARQQLRTPFIGSGGFADGRGLLAALALGASGINMGTRFMCTQEAPVHANIKQAIVNATENDTQLVLRRWKNTSRYFRNKVSEAAYEIEKTSATGEFKEVQPYVSGQRGRQVFINGDPDYGVCIHHGHCRAYQKRLKTMLTHAVGMDRRHLHWHDTRCADMCRPPQTDRSRSSGCITSQCLAVQGVAKNLEMAVV